MAEQTPLISVIVPVYMAEPYLAKCVDSIISQTYRNVEIVLVDDGSHDNCGKICDNYASKDSRAIVVHKENGGPGSAKNAGLSVAIGKYLMFIDSDDFLIDKYCFEKIADMLVRGAPDVLVFGYYDFIEISGCMKNRTVLPCNEKDAAQYLLFTDGFKATMWDKVVRRDIVEKYHMRATDNALGEDKHFSADLLRYSLRIEYLPVPIYVYRKRASSITHTYSENIRTACDNLVVVYDKALAIAASMQDGRHKRLYMAFWAHEFLADLGKFAPVYSEYQAAIAPFFEFWRCRLSFSVQTAYWFKRILGKRATVASLSCILMRKRRRHTKK